jgi:hypothetical protein
VDGAIPIEPMNHLQNRIEELNPNGVITVDSDTAQYRHLSMIKALADIGVRSRRVGRQRIHPLAMYFASHDRLGATGARGGDRPR